MIARIVLASTIQHFHNAILVLAGPKATGKTHLSQISFPSHRHVSLALPSEAARAQLDPAAFLAAYPAPVVIDDVHVAPRLIHHVRHITAGLHPRPAHVVLVGAQPRLVAATVREAFADDSCLVEVPGLSHAEGTVAQPQLTLNERILRGGFPFLLANPASDPRDYLRTLLADYLAHELPTRLRVDSVHDFERFLRAAALRTGRLLNKAELAREVGIVGSTAAIWIEMLLDAGIVDLLTPWQPPRGKPAVKAAKLYFRDTALCSHLLGIHDHGSLETSPHAPALWETYVFAEVRRLAATAAPGVVPTFWRDRTKEADFVVPTRRGLVVLDASWSELAATFDQRRLLRIRDELGSDAVATVAIVCRTPTRHSLREPAGPAVETVGIADIPGLLG